jgi:hypothetical protein
MCSNALQHPTPLQVCGGNPKDLGVVAATVGVVDNMQEINWKSGAAFVSWMKRCMYCWGGIAAAHMCVCVCVCARARARTN